MKSYSYKLINYVFSVAVYDLHSSLDQFVDAIPPKIHRSGIEEFLEPVFKVLFIVKGNAPPYGLTKNRKDSNLWVQGPENTADAEGPPIQALGVWL